jgi:hypothetical protein
VGPHDAELSRIATGEHVELLRMLARPAAPRRRRLRRRVGKSLIVAGERLAAEPRPAYH